MRIAEIISVPNWKQETSRDLMNSRFQNRDMKYLAHVAGMELWGSNWPPKDNSAFYLKDAQGDAVGYVTLWEVSGKVHRVGVSYIDPEYRNRNIIYRVYEWLLERNIHIISDLEQTPKARALWKKLWQNHNVKLLQDDDKIYPINSEEELELAYTNQGFRLYATK